MAKVFLSSPDFYNICKSIDRSLKKKGLVAFEYRDYQRKYGNYAGTKITYTTKTAYAVKRDDEVLIDTNGNEYSIIGDYVALKA